MQRLSLLGKKDTSLNAEQLRLILVSQTKCIGTLFHRLPSEIVHHICTVANPNPRLKKALHHAAHGELDALRALLEAAKQEGDEALKLLLLPTETTDTPGGLIAKNTTLLECAALAGDPEMIAMVKPYFSEVKENQAEMEQERKRQLARTKRCIDAMMTQQPENLTWLFNIIKAASAKDVAEELKTDAEYDWKYQSDLRNALNQWRQAKLDTRNRVIDVLRAPRMFCNYQNWIHVNEFLRNEWCINQWADLNPNGNNDDKIHLIRRQLSGFIELIELPACERFAFANDQVENPRAQITRSLKFKSSNGGSFPHFDSSSIKSHTGVGFGSFVSIYGWSPIDGQADSGVEHFKTFIKHKLQTCRTYTATSNPETERMQVRKFWQQRR